MNRLEHLMTILNEECAEVQQATSKALRFGLDEGRDIAAAEYGSNILRLESELNDLMAMVSMLIAEGLDLNMDSGAQERKKAKVEKYLLYSKECGTLCD